MSSDNLSEFEEYDRHVGTILNVLANVEGVVRTNSGKVLSFPKIAVIGDQSHGKSSLLMSMCRIPFPDGVGKKTMCPAVVNLKKTESDRWSGVAYRSGSDEAPRRIENRSQVGSVIDELQGNTISSVPVVVNINDPDVWNMTVVDIPGFYLSGPGQEEAEKILNRYIEDENCILLVVANILVLETSIMLDRINGELERRGESFKRRCVFVATRVNECDEANGGVPTSLQTVIQAEKYQPNGWFATMARPDIIKTEEERTNFIQGILRQREYERTEFSRLSYFSQNELLHTCGVENLARYLARILKQRVSEELQTYMSLINENLEKCTAVLNSIRNVDNSPITFGIIMNDLTTRFYNARKGFHMLLTEDEREASVQGPQYLNFIALSQRNLFKKEIMGTLQELETNEYREKIAAYAKMAVDPILGGKPNPNHVAQQVIKDFVRKWHKKAVPLYEKMEVIDSSDAIYYEVLPRDLMDYFENTVREEKEHAIDRLHFLFYDTTVIPSAIDVSSEGSSNSSNTQSSFNRIRAPVNSEMASSGLTSTSTAIRNDTSLVSSTSHALSSVDLELDKLYQDISRFLFTCASRYIDNVVQMMYTHFLINPTERSSFKEICDREFPFTAEEIRERADLNVLMQPKLSILQKRERYQIDKATMLDAILRLGVLKAKDLQ